MVSPFARRPSGEGIFGELVFGSLGIAVIAATALTLGSSPAISSSAILPSSAAGAIALAEDEMLRFVDVSELAFPEVPAPVEIEDEGTEADLDEAAAPEPDEGADEAEIPARPEKRSPQGEGEEQPSGRGTAEDEDEDPPARSGKPDPKTKAKGRRCPPPSDPGIIATAPGRWTIRQGVVQRYARDWSRLGELGWSQTHRLSNGQADGLLIGGLRCGSDLHDAGLRSGDVIHTVNGRKIHTVPQAILAYTALRNDDVFTVEITRRGKRQTLRYRLQ